MVGKSNSQLADDQREWTSLDAIVAFRAGRITAERYVSTLLERAEHMTTLNAFITMNADGVLGAAPRPRDGGAVRAAARTASVKWGHRSRVSHSATPAARGRGQRPCRL